MLESRVLLSGDSVLAAAFSGTVAHVHKPLPAVYEEAAAEHGVLNDSLSSHTDAGAGNIFEGITTEAIQSSSPAAAQAKLHSPVHSEKTAVKTETATSNNSVQNSSVTIQAEAVSPTTVSTGYPTKTVSNNSTISATSVTGTASAMIQQMTGSLRSANGPPIGVSATQSVNNELVTKKTTSISSSSASGSSSAGSTVSSNSTSIPDLLTSIINNISAIASGNGQASLSFSQASLGGVLTLGDGTAGSVKVSFTISNKTVTAVTVHASDATLNLGSAVTSTIGSIDGNYDVASKTFTLNLSSVQFSISSFVSISATGVNLTYDGSGTQSVTLTSGVTQSVSEVLLRISSATIFAGIGGPSNSGAVGVKLDMANLALALFSTSGGTTYYGISAIADSLKSVGLPGDISLSADSPNVQIDGSSDGSSTVVNFDDFKPGSGLTINTGAVDSSKNPITVNLDFTKSILQVSGNINLGLTQYIQISGGFTFTQTANEVDISIGSSAFTGAKDLTFTLGTTANPIFSATGSLEMSFTSTTFTLTCASLQVSSAIKIGSILEVDAFSASLTNLSVDLATENISGVVDSNGVHDPVLTVTAASATLFPGNTSITGGVTATTGTGADGHGVQGIFDLQTGAFSITLEQFNMQVGSIFTASASNVLVTYAPTDTDPHQQLVSIGSGTLDFKFGSHDITGGLTNLTIYLDGFHFDSVTLAYTGSIGLGSILTLTNPTVTLTDFGLTFASGNTTFTENGSLTVSVATATLNVGSLFSASAANLSITIALDPADLGNVTIMADTLTLQFGSIINITASYISINDNPAAGGDYLSVGSATVSLTLGSVLTLGGTATNFSIIDAGGTPQFHEDTGFGLSITATPGQLNLPSWLGFQIQTFEVKWNDFAAHPDQFQLILSASINSIQGLPGGVTVNGEITDAVIDTTKLEAGEFPIVSIGGFGGSVSGTLFGMTVNASFVLGIVSFNKENQIVNSDGTVYQLTPDSQGNVTETQVTTSLDTTIKNSVMFVGVAGGANILGVGGVQVYIGFSSLGPLTFYLNAQFPLLLDPDTGLAIQGFSGGVIFDYSIPTPSKPADLATTVISPAGISISQWEQQLRDQTVTQYTASNGGTNLSAAYNQPFVIEAGVMLDDAYLSSNVFSISGNIAIQIDPSAPNSTKIFVTGKATFGDTVSFNAYLYLNITVSGSSSTATVMFLAEAPASTPVETIGGTLKFGFTDASGNPITPTTPTTTTTTVNTTLPDGTPYQYTATSYTPPTQAIGGFYLSLDGFAQFSAFGALSATISGSVTLTVTGTFAKIDLSGDLNISDLGDLATASGELVVDYPGGLSGLQIYGALQLQTGNGFSTLQNVGLNVSGKATFILNTTSSSQTVYLPDPNNPHIAADATQFVINDTQSFEVTVAGVSSATFATLAYNVGNDTILNMQGDFDLKIDSSGLTIFANISSMSVGSSNSPYLTFSGYGLFVINSQGFAAEMNLTLNSQSIVGITLSAQFMLVMNTTQAVVTYTIPSTLPALTVPGSNPAVSVTTLTIPAGPPLGLIQADGTFAGFGAAGPYIVITGQGGVDFYNTSLTGTFYFQLSDSSAGLQVGLFVSISGMLPTIGQAMVTGGFQLSSNGVVALLTATAGAGSTSTYGQGISLQITAELAFNSTTTDVKEIDGVPLETPDNHMITIQHHSASVIASGTLTLNLGGGTGFVINGVFSTTEVDSGSSSTLVQQTTITASGTLTATINGSTLLTLNASGVLVFITGAGATGTGGAPAAGMAGELTLSVGTSNPLSGTGFNFNGTFDLEVNTTRVSQQVNVGTGTQTIAAGPNGSPIGSSYVEVHANGSLIFGTATNGFALTGDFYIAIGSTGLGISTNVTFTATVGGTQLMDLDATGALEIRSDGLVASLTLTASSGSPLSMNNIFSFSGTFTFQVNTTGNAINDMVGSVPLQVPAGPYFQVSVTNATLSLGSSSGFNLTGGFTLTISPAGLAISATATLNITVAGQTFFSLSADGGLLITSSGIAAKITLGTALGTGTVTPSGSDFQFGSTFVFVLEINTTGAAVPTINNLAVAIPAVDMSGNMKYFDVMGSGTLTLANIIKINGSFTISVGNNGLIIGINGTLNVFGIIFTVNGFAGIFTGTGDEGLALQITLSIGGSNSPSATLIPGVLAVQGSFMLEINTTNNNIFTVNGQTYSIATGTIFDISVPSASINLFGFTLASGGFDIKLTTNHSITVLSATGHFIFNFFGFAYVSVAFYFDSNFNFWFYGTTYVQLGSDSFNIHGSLTVEFASNSEIGALDAYDNVVIAHNFYLNVNGGVTAFSYTFASVGADVSVNGSDVSISAYVSVNLGLFSIGGTVTIDLGSINPLPAPPPPPALGTLNNGVLTLNIGPNAVNRLFNGADIAALSDEAYTITLVSNSGGSEDLWVNAPGVYTGPAEYAGTQNPISNALPGTVEYDNVTSIFADTGSSNTTISIAGNVAVPISITAGSGKNTFVMGGGQATITGTTGTDTVIGGSGGVIFHAGSGTSVFIGGNGNNTIYDPGTVSIIEGYTSSTYDTNTKQATPLPLYYTYYSLSGTVLTYGDGTTNYTDTLVGTFATVTLTAASSGATTFAVANYSGNVTLNANLNNQVTTSIQQDNGNLSLSCSVITESNGATGIITLENTDLSHPANPVSAPYGSLNLYGGPGDNTFTVTGWSGTGAVTLDGKEGSDTYIIYFLSTGSFTADVTDSGATGTDTLTVNGTTGDATININGSAVSSGAQTVSYSGIENLLLNTKNGNDIINVTSPSASTTINGGDGTDVYNVQSITDPATIILGAGLNTINVGSQAPAVSGGTLNQIAALLTVNGRPGGNNTIYLDDSADNSNSTATLTTTTLTGVFGPGGSLAYSNLVNFNLYLGNGNHTINVQGMNGVVNISLGSGANTLNIGSHAGPINTDPNSGNATNTGSVLTRINGILNFTGTGPQTINVDDSGSNIALIGGLWPTKITFLNLVTINFTNPVAINISLSQGDDLFAVDDTFASSATSPVIILDGNGGNDTFVILDTHAVMTVNGGDGEDNFYVLGNSGILNLNGDAGDDSFYIYASIDENTSNVNAGAADSNGNQIYSYRVNAAVNINGGTGNDRVFIYATNLNDVIYIDGTHVTGAGLDVTFTNVEQLVVAGLGGDDTFYIESIVIPTTVIGDGSIVPIPALTALGITLPDLNGGAPPPTSFNDTFYVGWQGASYIPGTLSAISAPLTIWGDNGPNLDGTTTNTPGTNDTIYVDDSADTANRNFTLTSTMLTGAAFGSGGSLTFDSAVENLNIQSGSGANDYNIYGTGTATQTSVYGGAGNDSFYVFSANVPSYSSPLAIFGQSNTFAGDTLTIVGAPNGNNFDITGFTVDGVGATISYETIEKLVVNASGPTNFTVDGDLVPTFLNGSNAGDTFVVNSNIVPLYFTGGTGDDTISINANSGLLIVDNADGTNTVTINGNSGTANINGGAGTFLVNGNSGNLTILGNTGYDNFLVRGNSGQLTITGGSGGDSFTVDSLSASAILYAGTGTDSFTVNAPLAATLTVNGGGYSNDTLTVNGTTGNDYFTITNSSVSSVGATINYNATSLVINGVAGNDTFQIVGTAAGTTRINGGNYGNDTFNVQASTGALYLTGGAIGNNTFNLGSSTPVGGGTLAGLIGPIYLAGGTNLMRLITLATPGTTTVNLDDAGDTVGNTGVLTASTFTGFGLGAGITFNSVNVMNIYLGSGNEVLNIQGTNSHTITTVNTGSGTNTVNVGSLAPTNGGVLSGIQGSLNIISGGNDTLNLDDTGDTINQIGWLTSSTLTGLGLGNGLTYTAVSILNLNLGFGNDTFNIRSTSSKTVTTINTGAGTNTLNIGSLAPATGGVIDNIQGPLIIVGSGDDILNVDDTGSMANKSGTLTATSLTGLNLGAGGITYSGLATLTIILGSGNDTFTVAGAPAATATTIDGGLGTNTAIINVTGNLAGQNLTLLNFVTTSIAITGNFSGILNDQSAITTVTIGGSLTSSAVLNVGSLGTMTVGGDLAGLLQVSGLLGTLTVTGGTPGKIIAGNIHVITVLAGYGNKVLQVIQGGIERQIQAAPVTGGTLPKTVTFAFVYDAVTGTSPQLAIRITNPNSTPRSFNLELAVINSATAKFNLSLIDSTANSHSGISNVTVQGDLLTKITAPELALFTDLTASSRAGVVLPVDSITGVEVSDILPIGSIDVAGIEGIAFSILTTAAGTLVNVSTPLGAPGSPQSLWNLLGSTPAINPASDAFVVTYNQTEGVRFFADNYNTQDFNLIATYTDTLLNNLPITLNFNVTLH